MVVGYGDSNMKETIKGVLEDIADSQPNLHSESAREMIANLITAALKSKDDLGVDEHPYPSDFGDTEREEEKAKWVCELCGKNTFDVDWDYIGSNYNHLGCELLEGFDKIKDNNNDYVYSGDMKKDPPSLEGARGTIKVEKKKRKKWNEDAGDGHMIPVEKMKTIHNTDAKIQAESPYNDGYTRKYYQDLLSEEIVGENSLGYIYESPDGGETVYRRKVGESERELVSKKDWEQYNRNR